MRRTLSIILLSLACSVTAVTAEEFHITSGGPSEIVFRSKAPMETFEGRTRQVRGRIVADLDSLAGTVDVSISVDLASLKTGRRKRDEHMRTRHLETDRFPEAVFRGGVIRNSNATAILPGQTVALELQGDFDLHGVVRPMICRAELNLRADGTLEITTSFPVLLSDHAIPRPKFLVMKLADKQQIHVHLIAEPVARASQP